MSIWSEYPSDYREIEVAEIRQAVCAGECAAIIGLSGSGKSNLLGYLAYRTEISVSCPRFIFIDCNRLAEPGSQEFFKLFYQEIEEGASPAPKDMLGDHAFTSLRKTLQRRLSSGQGICVLLDRFDSLLDMEKFAMIASNLRAFRDENKYRLSYVTGTRLPLDAQTELAELFFGHTIWLGPLSRSDAIWSARRDLERLMGRDGKNLESQVIEKLIEFTWGYPSFLRAACEAYAAGTNLTIEEICLHPSVVRRISEFWADKPGKDALKMSGLLGHPLLKSFLGIAQTTETKSRFDTTHLTSKENLLLEYLMDHPSEVCEKDDLIQAIWSEDVIFQHGIRDESLAQLVRRLRVKVEKDPAKPIYIHTVPGRGYIFREQTDSQE